MGNLKTGILNLTWELKDLEGIEEASFFLGLCEAGKGGGIKK